MFRRLLDEGGDERAVARAGACLPPARSARGDSRRTVRHRACPASSSPCLTRSSVFERCDARRPTIASIIIGGADPLNLTGIIIGDERIRASPATRIVLRNGVAVAAMEGDMLRTFGDLDPEVAADAAAAAAGRRVPVVSGFVGRLG